MEDVELRRQLIEHLKSSGCEGLDNLAGSQEHAVELFAAWMAAMRDLRRGQGACEIFSRFMDRAFPSRLNRHSVFKPTLCVQSVPLKFSLLFVFLS